MTATSADISTDIVNIKTASLTDDTLSQITDFASALAALDTGGISYEGMDEYGTGFVVVDKDTLVGVPFVVVEWRFNKSELSDKPFVSATCVTKAGQKVIINDGSTGMRDQLLDVTAKRLRENSPNPQSGLMVWGGLTVSNYLYTDEKGKRIPATTYYLSEAPAPQQQ